MWLCARRLQNTVTPTCHYGFFSRPPTRLRPTEQVSCVFGMFFRPCNPCILAFSSGASTPNMAQYSFFAHLLRGEKNSPIFHDWRSCLCTSPLASTRHGRLSRLHSDLWIPMVYRIIWRTTKLKNLWRLWFAQNRRRFAAKDWASAWGIQHNPQQRTSTFKQVFQCALQPFHSRMRGCTFWSQRFEDVCGERTFGGTGRDQICHKACRNQNVEVQ